MKVGDRLKNGALVLAVRGEVILAFTGAENVQPFVTWKVDEKGHTYWGHYAYTIEEAVADLDARAPLAAKSA